MNQEYLFNMPYKLAITFESVYEILNCDDSNVSCPDGNTGAVYYVVQILTQDHQQGTFNPFPYRAFLCHWSSKGNFYGQSE